MELFLKMNVVLVAINLIANVFNVTNHRATPSKRSAAVFGLVGGVGMMFWIHQLFDQLAQCAALN